MLGHPQARQGTHPEEPADSGRVWRASRKWPGPAGAQGGRAVAQLRALQAGWREQGWEELRGWRRGEAETTEWVMSAKGLRLILGEVGWHSCALYGSCPKAGPPGEANPSPAMKGPGNSYSQHLLTHISQQTLSAGPTLE